MKKIPLIALVIIGSLSGFSKTIYVSTMGKDSNDGSKKSPVANLDKAQQLARSVPQGEPVIIQIQDGVYYLNQSLDFTAADNRKSLLIEAEHEGKVVISGGKELHLKWEKLSNGQWKASIDSDDEIDQLYINGKRQRMARFPNAIDGMNVFDTWELNHSIKSDSTNNPLLPSRIDRWENPKGGYIHAMHSALWGDMHWIIKGKNADGKLDYEGGWQNNRPSPMHPVYRMVENIREELDAPGEWYYDQDKRVLYSIPEKGTEMDKAKIEIVRLKQLITFNGTSDHPVSDISFKGVVFRHAARTFMENKEPLLRSDWTVCRLGAIVFRGAKNCTIDDCEFDQLGGNTIVVDNYNRQISIRGCYIHHSGANGVVFVGDPKSVRNPIFRYGKQNFGSLDLTPGPIGNNYPDDCLVENCLITMTGRDEKQTAPIHISMSHKIHVNHCTIYDVPRAGININEGTFGDHLIENCDIFNTVLETGDHGSFNSWGRDRYWTPDINETIPEVAKNKELPFLDMIGPNILRNNRWRCDHGWDIDLDDGSTRYRIYNNVLLNGGLKLREGYDRIVTNNIILNNSLHPHVWYTESGDVFKNNIVFGAYRPAVMNRAIAKDGKWGKEIDKNLFVCSESQIETNRIHGCDQNSLSGDPLFIAPESGDYTVKPGSPALRLGFVNFDQSHFGVTKPALMAKAKKPVIPRLVFQIENADKAVVKRDIKWAGCILSEPKGDELSAFGVDFSTGGVALSMSPESRAIKMGFRNGDMIIEIDKEKIRDIDQFRSYLLRHKTATMHRVEVIRNQMRKQITVQEEFPQIE